MRALECFLAGVHAVVTVNENWDQFQESKKMKILHFSLLFGSKFLETFFESASNIAVGHHVSLKLTLANKIFFATEGRNKLN